MNTNIFSSHTSVFCSIFRTIYTCALNSRGGVEIDLTVTPIKAGVAELHDPDFKGIGMRLLTLLTKDGAHMLSFIDYFFLPYDVVIFFEQFYDLDVMSSFKFKFIILFSKKPKSLQFLHENIHKSHLYLHALLLLLLFLKPLFHII